MGASNGRRSANRAAIILAGGDGTRLRRLTRFITGHPVPKQFCPVTGDRTLLEETIRRVSLLVPIDRMIVVVNAQHRPYYEPLLRGLRPSQVVEQPCNKGTAPAILYGLYRLGRLCGSDPAVTIFPSDHFVGDDVHFMKHVGSALHAVDAFPPILVLLGMAPTSAETSYGWIEPAALVSSSKSELFHVARFWEKPELELAKNLWRKGCLWNSFVVAARASVIRKAAAEYAPDLSASFEAVSTGTCDDERAIEDLYARMPEVGFPQQVLSQCPPNLAVQRVDDVAWSDLGEPDRVLDILKMIGRRPAWLDSFARHLSAGSLPEPRAARGLSVQHL